MSGLDVSGYLDDGALDLEGVSSKRYPDGHTYRVESPSWPDTLRIRRLVGKYGGQIPGAGNLEEQELADLTALVGDDSGGTIGIEEKILGPALAKMIDDGVPAVSVDRLVTVSLIHFGMSEDSARLLVGAAAGEANARENRAAELAEAKKLPASKPRAGSSSSRASGARNTPATRAAASTRASKTSATRTRTPKTA